MRGQKQIGILQKFKYYHYTNNTTGEIISGANGLYIPDETLEHYENDGNDEHSGEMGFSSYEFKLPYEYKNKIRAVPGYYNFKIEMRDIKEIKEYNGVKTTSIKPALTVVDLEYIGKVKAELDPD